MLCGHCTGHCRPCHLWACIELQPRRPPSPTQKFLRQCQQSLPHAHKVFLDQVTGVSGSCLVQSSHTETEPTCIAPDGILEDKQLRFCGHLLGRAGVVDRYLSHTLDRSQQVGSSLEAVGPIITPVPPCSACQSPLSQRRRGHTHTHTYTRRHAHAERARVRDR